MMMMNMGGSGGSMGSMGQSMGQNMTQMPNMGQMPGMAQYPYSMPYGNMQGMPGGMTGQGANMAQGAHGATNVLGGSDFTSLLTTLFNFTLNIFVILLVVGLIVGTVVYIKRLITGGGQMTGFLTSTTKPICNKCGQPVQAQWNVCPICGENKINAMIKPAGQPV